MNESINTFPYYRLTRTIISPAILIMCFSYFIYANDISMPGEIPENQLEYHAGIIWGTENVWLPNPTLWVQYEQDLGERSMVDFETGKACVQIMLKADDNPDRKEVLDHLKQGVGNLILRKPSDPVEMIKNRSPEIAHAVVTASGPIKIPAENEIRIYMVKKGDSLWKISRRFGMKTDDLIRLNNLNKNEPVHAGQPIKVFVYTSHDLTLDSEPADRAGDPILLDQIRMVDGRPVDPSMVREFAVQLIEKKPPESIKITGGDGIERLVVSIGFRLVSNHLEVRARKFYPMVLKYAEKNSVDPAVIMGIIHTESMFNPMARSRTPAYGLMQLVPDGGGNEAYSKIHDQNQNLTPQYLYNPENNIELGTVYYNILKNKYMGDINDPQSRTYCAVAAYNAGVSNVGYAFISKKSITMAYSAINSMAPQDVYSKLIKNLPFKESRGYVRKVFKRAEVYRDWDNPSQKPSDI